MPGAQAPGLAASPEAATLTGNVALDEAVENASISASATPRTNLPTDCFAITRKIGNKTIAT